MTGLSESGSFTGSPEPPRECCWFVEAAARARTESRGRSCSNAAGRLELAADCLIGAIVSREHASANARVRRRVGRSPRTYCSQCPVSCLPEGGPTPVVGREARARQSEIQSRFIAGLRSQALRRRLAAGRDRNRQAPGPRSANRDPRPEDPAGAQLGEGIARQAPGAQRLFGNSQRAACPGRATTRLAKRPAPPAPRQRGRA